MRHRDVVAAAIIAATLSAITSSLLTGYLIDRSWQRFGIEMGYAAPVTGRGGTDLGVLWRPMTPDRPHKATVSPEPTPTPAPPSGAGQDGTPQGPRP